MTAGDAALWAGVVAIGAWHGLNPAMGWPLALANGLAARRGGAVAASFVPLGAGHLLAMLLVLLPFALLSALAAWSREIRVGAGAVVVLFGVFRLLRPRHPRWLARVRPSQLLLWSLLVATAHGAALMLLPVLIGLCAAPAGPFAHAEATALMRSSVGAAVAVSLVHTAAMIGAGLATAWAVYRWLGLRALRAAWFDVERAWAACLVVAGAAAIALALA
jgi:hypothetical protein